MLRQRGGQSIRITSKLSSLTLDSKGSRRDRAVRRRSNPRPANSVGNDLAHMPARRRLQVRIEVDDAAAALGTTHETAEHHALTGLRVRGYYIETALEARPRFARNGECARKILPRWRGLYTAVVPRPVELQQGRLRLGRLETSRRRENADQRAQRALQPCSVPDPLHIRICRRTPLN